ncbi:hypothetical protein M9H77_30457 [Catharanthus roseus]|uniref:Uncharacterized protein n=1 Tax=Catharanthus roseus TaxID=4058 RepID=A0ACB9ZZ56_CATRO|nr:hypothetical protein M9H77_30457 [Catharanthus roseus]
MLSNYSESICVDSMLLECLEEVTVVVETSIEDSLAGSVVSSEKGAFKLYNDHVFSFCDMNQRHYMRSQRRVTINNAGYLQELKDSGASLAVGLRVLKKQSMGNKHPITLMTDQFAAMVAAIGVVFPKYKASFVYMAYWEKFKEAYYGLRSKKDFVKQFNHVLKNTDTCLVLIFTVPSFYNLLDKFACHNDSWLNRLYYLREKWCPTFSKDFFSGGILSSQRNKATNHALSKTLSKTTKLCDFYRIFDEVVSEWRSNANMEDFRYKEGLFEEQFMKFPKYYQELVMFNEVGILYFHCLRIFNILYVQAIPDKYILKRWTNDIDLILGSSSVGDLGKVSKIDIASSSAWRREILRKFSDLISTSELNINARECIEKEFRMLKDKIASEVGHYYVDDSDNEVGSSKIKDSVGRHAKA